MVINACNVENTLTADYFNQTKWKAMHGSLATKNPREKMVTDLKTNYLKLGMSQPEVEALLGFADRINHHQYLYRLGIGEFSADYSYLTLIYDDDGTLIEIRNAQS
jgi:hypothetical protein